MKNKIGILRALLTEEMSLRMLTGGKRGRNEVKRNVLILVGEIEAIMGKIDPDLMQKIYGRRARIADKEDSQAKPNRPWMN